MKTSAACLPGSTLFGRRELLEPKCRLYGLAVEDAEFTVFIQHLNRKMQTEKQRYPCGSSRQLPQGHFFLT